MGAANNSLIFFLAGKKKMVKIVIQGPNTIQQRQDIHSPQACPRLDQQRFKTSIIVAQDYCSSSNLFQNDHHTQEARWFRSSSFDKMTILSRLFFRAQKKKQSKLNIAGTWKAKRLGNLHKAFDDVL